MSGKVVHFEIPTDDLDRAGMFYAGVFAWNLQPMPGSDYLLVGTVASDARGMPTEAGAINGGITPRRAPVTAPLVVVDVDDIEAALSRIESLGGTTVQGRQQVGDMGFNAYFTDPDGNTLGLWQNAR